MKVFRLLPLSLTLWARLALPQPLCQSCYISGPSPYLYPYLNTAGGTSWAKGTSVTLYIVSTSGGPFTSGEQSDIATALTNWNTTSGSSLNITSTVLSGPPVPVGSYIIVQRGDPSACGAGVSACVQWTTDLTTGQTLNATITIESSFSGSSFLPLLAHEMGHTYQIADCVGCDTTKTIMNPMIGSSSPTQPLKCDLRLLWEVTPSNRYGVVCTN
jgi:hypothetical protein